MAEDQPKNKLFLVVYDGITHEQEFLEIIRSNYPSKRILSKSIIVLSSEESVANLNEKLEEHFRKYESLESAGYFVTVIDGIGGRLEEDTWKWLSEKGWELVDKEDIT